LIPDLKSVRIFDSWRRRFPYTFKVSSFGLHLLTLDPPPGRCFFLDQENAFIEEVNQLQFSKVSLNHEGEGLSMKGVFRDA
jgi:hypothetical protein